METSPAEVEAACVPPAPAPLSWPADSRLSTAWVASLAELLLAASLAPAAELRTRLPLFLLLDLVAAATEALSAEETLVALSPVKGASVVVVGDTHGQFHDVLRLLELAGSPTPERLFVWNGDYVDRGAWGVETLALLLAWKVALPHCVTLLRGNHETSVRGRAAGAGDPGRALTRLDAPSLSLPPRRTASRRSWWPSTAAATARSSTSSSSRRATRSPAADLALTPSQLFGCLPLGAHVGATLVCHGGLFRKPTRTRTRIAAQEAEDEAATSLPLSRMGSLADLRAAKRGGPDPMGGGVNQLAADLLWSDPGPAPGLCVNALRGIGLVYGPDASAEFLRANSLRLIIRSHEGPDARQKRADMAPMMDGWTTDHVSPEGTLATLFSAPDYPQFTAPEDVRTGNRAAFCVLREPHFCEPEVTSFDAAPRPAARPYYDLDVGGSDEEGPAPAAEGLGSPELVATEPVVARVPTAETAEVMPC